MRANEIIQEETVARFNVDGLMVSVDKHVRDQARDRQLNLKTVGYALSRLASIRNKLDEITAGQKFWVYDEKQDLSLGIRKISPNNLIYHLKTVVAGKPYQQGSLPHYTIPSDANIEEGWREKTAAALTAATLGYGGYHNINKQDINVPQAAKYAAQKEQSKPFVLTFADKNPVRDYLVQRGRQAGFTDKELAHLVAQVAHETMDFKHLEEIGTPKYFARKYDKRYNPRKAKILGNIKLGDGERFKGRGFVHLTGRDNYTRAGRALGVDLVNQPQLAADPKIAADIAVWYWKNRVKPDIDDFSTATVAQVTKPINPGLKGLQDREAKFQKIVNR